MPILEHIITHIETNIAIAKTDLYQKLDSKPRGSTSGCCFDVICLLLLE